MRKHTHVQLSTSEDWTGNGCMLYYSRGMVAFVMILETLEGAASDSEADVYSCLVQWTTQHKYSIFHNLSSFVI